jgi:hypothetical protein
LGGYRIIRQTTEKLMMELMKQEEELTDEEKGGPGCQTDMVGQCQFKIFYWQQYDHFQITKIRSLLCCCFFTAGDYMYNHFEISGS